MRNGLDTVERQVSTGKHTASSHSMPVGRAGHRKGLRLILPLDVGSYTRSALGYQLKGV